MNNVGHIYRKRKSEQVCMFVQKISDPTEEILKMLSSLKNVFLFNRYVLLQTEKQG